MSNTEMRDADMEDMQSEPTLMRQCKCRSNISLECLRSGVRRRDTKIEQLQKHVNRLETETELIKKKDEEIIKLKEENEQLRRQLAKNTPNFNTPNTVNSNKLIDLIEEKLKYGLSIMKTDVVNLIDEKLDSKKKFEDRTATQHSYADAARSTNTEMGMTKLRSKILEEKNALLTEEMDKRNRNRNVIIHGKSEAGAAGDKCFAETLLKDIQVGSIPINQIERIGSKTETKPERRPIKITFNKEEDRNKVLNSLRNLKGSNAYNGVSITPDYTNSERLLIKEFHNEAKERTYEEKENGTGYVWKIRGTLTSGLFLKRIKENYTIVNLDI